MPRAELPSNAEQLAIARDAEQSKIPQSDRARIHFEAVAWMEHHPEYNSTPSNGNKIGAWISKHKLPVNADSFDKAFTALSKQGHILPLEEEIQRMNSADYMEYCKNNGDPIYENGRLMGYTDPLAKVPLVKKVNPNDPDRPRGVTRPRRPIEHPEDFEREITKREFHSFDSDRAGDFMEHYGPDWVNHLH